jgi:hypothetical protein
VPLVLRFSRASSVATDGNLRLDKVSSEDTVIPFDQQICGCRLGLDGSETACQLLLVLEVGLPHLILDSSDLSRSLNVPSGLLPQALDVTLCLTFFDPLLNGAKFLLMIFDENVQLVNILVEMFLLAKLFLGISPHPLQELEITLGLS